MHTPGGRAGIRLGTTGSTSLIPAILSVRTPFGNTLSECRKQASTRLFAGEIGILRGGEGEEKD
jgi:hypothetical protein